MRRLVNAAIEGIEPPDRRRLAAIERDLLARRRRRTVQPWWWIVLGAGLATGAVAAYWGVQGERSQRERVEVPAEPASGASTAPDESAAGDGEPDRPSGGQRGDDDRIIYFGQ